MNPDGVTWIWTPGLPVYIRVMCRHSSHTSTSLDGPKETGTWLWENFFLGDSCHFLHFDPELQPVAAYRLSLHHAPVRRRPWAHQTGGEAAVVHRGSHLFQQPAATQGHVPLGQSKSGKMWIFIISHKVSENLFTPKLYVTKWLN